MKTVLKALLLVLFPFFSFSQQKKLLQQNYNFPNPDGINALHQSNDTLYELKCQVGRPCGSRPERHFKIISIQHSGHFHILKLERLDTIPMTTDHYPAARYFVLALRDLNQKQLGYLMLNSNLTRNQLDTVNINVALLKDNFSLTFFSDSYIKELSRLKTITTVQQAEEIMAAVKSKINDPVVQRYKRTQTGDIIAAGLVAELVTMVCIEKGYNPAGAEDAINSIARKNHLQEKR